MLSLNCVGFTIDYHTVPLMADAATGAGRQLPGGASNQEYTDPRVELYDSEAARLVLNDAQTSGGLPTRFPQPWQAGSSRS
jgi:hypothetical protein